MKQVLSAKSWYQAKSRETPAFFLRIVPFHSVTRKFLSLLILLSGIQTFAWGKRGHEITADTAAWLLGEQTNMQWLRNHSYDLGYYANVPDIIWKNLGEEGYKFESPYHYFDWNTLMQETFSDQKKLPENFQKFKETLGSNYKRKNGLLLWRISALYKNCANVAQKLSKETQGDLLVCLGTMAHYTGDLAQPLHVSDNYDGQKTNQKGIHAYFETFLVNYLDPEIRSDVRKRALALFKKADSTREIEQLIRTEMKNSFAQVPALLETDSKNDRKNVSAAALAHRKMIVEQLARGAVITALLWQQILLPVKTFSEEKFYYFNGAPAHIRTDFE